MDIIGLGIDATDLHRIAAVYKEYGDRFLRRVYTDGEITYCTRQRDPVPSLAGRFAAKEAAMKALGTGHTRGVLWKDIEVHRTSGPPQLWLHGTAATLAAEIGVERTLLSISHSDTVAVAQVLLFGTLVSAG